MKRRKVKHKVKVKQKVVQSVRVVIHQPARKRRRRRRKKGASSRERFRRITHANRIEMRQRTLAGLHRSRLIPAPYTLTTSEIMRLTPNAAQRLGRGQFVATPAPQVDTSVGRPEDATPYSVNTVPSYVGSDYSDVGSVYSDEPPIRIRRIRRGMGKPVSIGGAAAAAAAATPSRKPPPTPRSAHVSPARRTFMRPETQAVYQRRLEEGTTYRHRTGKITGRGQRGADYVRGRRAGGGGGD